MAEEAPTMEEGKGQLKRRLGRKKGGKAKKKMKVFQGTGEKKVKINNRMRKLFRKRAREYNSDDDDESSPTHVGENTEELLDNNKVLERPSREREAKDEENEMSEEEHDEIQPGITKFTEGCRTFRKAFKKIIKKSVPDDSLGPVLSGHKKLVVEKLAEEDTERKVKGEAKKEKHLLGEKGHVKPANFLDPHEKFLIGVATKGVVKLFNAVNKAQNAQKGLNPSRSKDAKALRKRRKEAFFSELGKTPSVDTPAQDPGWAPLRDGYMLTNSKLKDWDKVPSSDAMVEDEMPVDTSSDDED